MVFFLAIALFALISFYLLRQNGTIAPGPSTATGPLSAYFKQITHMQLRNHDGFFVTAMASDKTTFVQVSVSQKGTDNWHYLFDMPVTAWSEAFRDPIEAEARARGLTPQRVDGVDDMYFLDIEFSDRVAHDGFATWVIEEVFGLPKDEPFEITWG